MKKIILASVMVFVLAPLAYANCENYTDGSSEPAPKVILCYKGKCDDTTLNYICSSGPNFSSEYANGLQIYTTNKKLVFTNKTGKKMKREDWTCKEADTSEHFDCEGF